MTINERMGIVVFRNIMSIVTLMSLFSVSAFAEEVAAASAGGNGMAALAAAIAIGVAVFGGAFGQSKAASAALEGMSRNPAAAGKLLVPMIIALALIESLVLLAFVIAFVKIQL